MKVSVSLIETANPVTYNNVVNSYTKGPLYCIMTADTSGHQTVHKFPITSIFLIKEEATQDEEVPVSV